jgi:hypothetical protein
MRRRPREENADALAAASVKRAERLGAIEHADNLDDDAFLDGLEGQERDVRATPANPREEAGPWKNLTGGSR